MPTEPEKRDIVVKARELLNAPNSFTLRQEVRELLRQLCDEVEQLRRGEFICSRCHLRKDADRDESESPF